LISVKRSIDQHPSRHAVAGAAGLELGARTENYRGFARPVDAGHGKAPFPSPIAVKTQRFARIRTAVSSGQEFLHARERLVDGGK
jgi:hypothetical protein